jgi:hypothetical protein
MKSEILSKNPDNFTSKVENVDWTTKIVQVNSISELLRRCEKISSKANEIILK